jgi:hypothetical protein
MTEAPAKCGGFYASTVSARRARQRNAVSDSSVADPTAVRPSAESGAAGTPREAGRDRPRQQRTTRSRWPPTAGGSGDHQRTAVDPLVGRKHSSNTVRLANDSSRSRRSDHSRSTGDRSCELAYRERVVPTEDLSVVDPALHASLRMHQPEWRRAAAKRARDQETAPPPR